VELSPGDPDHPPPGGLERPVTRAIGLEGAAAAVRGVAVELDHQALRTPDAVTLDQAAGDLHGGIDLRPREADALEEREEALLKVAAGGVLAGASGGDDTAERRRAGRRGWRARSRSSETRSPSRLTSAS